MGDQKKSTGRNSVSRRGFMAGAGVGAVGAVVGREVAAQEFIDLGSIDDLGDEWWLDDPTPTDPVDPVPTDPQPPVTDPGPVPQAGVPIRQDIYTLPEAGQQIQALRRGIAAMKARSPQNPTSWWFQANIHAGRVGPQVAVCQHSNRYFLSWHRMYLFFFEKMLRQASGDPSLTLPYWDYSVPGRAALPRATIFPADETQNPLYWANREPFFNAGNPLPPNVVFTDETLRRPFFDESDGFNRQLELTPHNGIHRAIGGRDGSMGSAETAGQDPIFWLHHCNIDRQWNRWLARGGTHRNPTDLDFISQRFNFYDENATLLSISGADILDTQTLGYRYDDDALPPIGFDPSFVVASADTSPAPPPTFQTVTRTLSNGDTVTETITSQPQIAAMSVAAPSALAAPQQQIRRIERPLAVSRQAIRLGSGRTKIRLSSAIARPQRIIQRRVVTQPTGTGENVPPTFAMIAERVSEPAPEMFVTSAASDASPVLLQLENIEFDRASVIYNIFVNLPEGDEPDVRGPYYAAYFAPFAQNMTDEPEVHDITGLLNRQIEGGLWDGGDIDVQFVAVDAAGRVTSVVADPVSIGQVRIIRK